MRVETAIQIEAPFKSEFELGVQTVINIQQRTHRLLELIAENEKLAEKTGWFAQLRRKAKYGCEYDHLIVGFPTFPESDRSRKPVLRGPNGEILTSDTRYKRGEDGEDMVDGFSIYSGSLGGNRLSLVYDRESSSINGMLWLPPTNFSCFFALSASKKPEIATDSIAFDGSEPTLQLVDIMSLFDSIDHLHSTHFEVLMSVVGDPRLDKVWTSKDEARPGLRVGRLEARF